MYAAESLFRDGRTLTRFRLFVCRPICDGSGHLPTLIEAELDQRHGQTVTDLLHKIKNAAQEWAEECPTHYTLMGACGDSNVGDLSVALDEPDLVECLAKRGVENLKIEPLTQISWTYDTPLLHS